MSFLSQKFGDTAVVWQKFANARFFPRKFAKARLTKSLERLPTSLPPDIIRWVESALVCGTGIDEILNLEKSREEWSIFFYLELENWMFISRDVLNCQDFEETILVLLSKFKILKKNSLSLLDWMRFCKKILFKRVNILREKLSFSSWFFHQFLFQFWWEIIFWYLVGFWPAVFCRKGKYVKRTVLYCWAIF